MAKQKTDEIIEKIINESLDVIMSNCFSRYSKYIIQQRALPDARDGLKPVQRRILFSMWQMNLTSDKAFKKSARVVGDVIGKYHPHGDSSIYEALIRMAQEWKMAYPLVEMHGNKGSIDDDPAAAMRYTETRLEKISNLLLGEIDKKIVPFAPNFDDTEYEPVVLPTLFPNLLSNGSKGIAEGYATDIPPHNLKELLDASIEIIKNPGVTNKKLLSIIKGPDFPTGAIISDLDGFKDAFETGRGRISIYSKTDFDKNRNGDIIGIEITEIPYGVIKIELIKQIQNFIFNKTIGGIKDIRDQSNREGISIYIELDKDANAEAILNFLYQKTDLKKYYNYNMVSISDNAPKLLGIRQLLDIYIAHINNCETLSLTYDEQKLSKRLEIVSGLIRVSEISDEVIKVIRNSENSKKGVIEALMNVFNFTELQATAIAELRLYKLSKMDQNQYLEEKIDLEGKLKRIHLLLNDPEEFKKYLISLLNDIKKDYAVERRSYISSEDIEIEIDEKDLAKDEDFYLYVTLDNYIKKISLKIQQSNELSTFGLKEGDCLQFASKINSLTKLIFFTSQGNYFVLDAFNLKDNGWKDIGNHVSDYVRLQDNEKIIKVYNIKDTDFEALFLLSSKNGYGKRIKLSEFSEVTNRKLSCMKLKDKSDELIGVSLTNNHKNILAILSDGLYHYFEEAQVPIYSLKASGIMMVKPNSNYLNQVVCLDENDKLIMTNDRGQFKKIIAKNIPEVKRQNVAKILYWPLKTSPFSVVDATIFESGLEYYYVNEAGELDIYVTDEIPNSNVKENFSVPRIKPKASGRFIYQFCLDKTNKEFVIEEKNLTDADTKKEVVKDQPKPEKLFNEQASKSAKETKAADDIKRAEWLDIDELIESALKKAKD